MPKAHDLGQRCYDLAKLRFYAGREVDSIEVIIGSVFLQWWNQTGPEHISIDNSSFWLRIAVALAHQTGLHKEPDNHNVQRALRRRLWWALVSRDNQIATSHGRPRALNPEDSDMRPLGVKDFDAADEDALTFMNFVRITTILGDLSQACLRGGLSHRQRLEFEVQLQDWLQQLPAAFHLHDRSSRRSTPYTFRSRQLHVPYLVSLVILFRQKTPEKCPPGVSVVAASFISGIFEEYLDWGDIAFVSAPSIFYLLVASLVQASSNRFPVLATHRAKEKSITKNAITELKKRFHTAYGADRVIRSVTKVTSHVPSQAIDLELDPHQHRLIDFFGPDLCLQWDNVLSATTTTSVRDSEWPSGPSLTQPRVTQPVLPDASTFLQPAEMLIAGQDAHAYDSSAWTGGPFVNPDGLFHPGSDAMGQWWWADLVPSL